MRRSDLWRQLPGIEAVVSEEGCTGVAIPDFNFGFQVLPGNVIGGNQSHLPTQFGGHVAQSHAFLHRELADRVAAVFDGLVLAAVEAEAADEEQHHVLRGNARAEALEHRLHAPRPARVVHHRQVDPAGDDLAGRDRAAAGCPRHQLLGQRLAHPCSRNSFSDFSGGLAKLERRLTLPAPSLRSLIAISALFAITVMPLITGAPSISPENSIIGRPPAGTMTSAPASSRARHSRSHFGCSFLKPSSVEKASMKSVIFASTARTAITRCCRP